MTKEEFNKLDIHKKVEYINANIQKFGSASNVCKELNINIETFRNNIRNLYTYIPYFQKYIRISDLENCLEISQENNSNGCSKAFSGHPIFDRFKFYRKRTR